MKSSLLLSLIPFFFLSCTEKASTDIQNDTSATNPPADTSSAIYSDDGEAGFHITSIDSSNGYYFNTTETTYKVAFIALHDFTDLKHYIAKYTTDTKSCTGCEVQDRKIKVELKTFEKPENTELTIQQECDELTLDVHDYKTAKFGCCGAEDDLAVYDYNNKLVIRGDATIIYGDIPNSQVSFYVSYKPEYKDSTILGVLYLSYSSTDQYSITIKSKPLPEDYCSLFSPDVVIESTDPDDKFEEATNEYTLWSLDEIKSNSEINHLTLKVMYECDSKLHLQPLLIPIIKGKPFGKEERNQSVVFKHE
ncbi:MAG TPA: hypothetical protein VFG10_15145 [Saprospiraceae bacterium]|nr:hypothetical protein [Saprospiraceae bacterium]